MERKKGEAEPTPAVCLVPAPTRSNLLADFNYSRKTGPHAACYPVEDCIASNKRTALNG